MDTDYSRHEAEVNKEYKKVQIMDTDYSRHEAEINKECLKVKGQLQMMYESVKDGYRL